MTDSELRALLSAGREQRNVECKNAGSRNDRAFAATVIRASMAMANKRDGGFVVIGIDDDGTQLVPRGLDAVQSASWRFDDVADLFRSYMDPAIEFNVSNVELDGLQIVVIAVAEFDDIPILCKRGYERVLRDGACYVRSRRKPESVEVPSHIEMRELLDLAADKNMRRFVARMGGVGLFPAAGVPTDSEKYDEELGDLK